MKKSDKNSIDPDKVTETPSILPYAHHVGSAIIRPIDKGRLKGTAMTAMYHQTDKQLNQIKEQVQLLIQQAQEIHDRIDMSEKIYEADCGFKPVIGNIYYLYEKEDGSLILSMISPEEWSKCPYTFLYAAKLAGDHTWEIIENKENG